MSEVARELSELLSHERRAALEADVDALEAIQETKRALIDRAATEGALDSPAFAQLAAVARANLGLIRQLVALHRGLAGVDDANQYGADGAPAGPAVTYARGAL